MGGIILIMFNLLEGSKNSSDPFISCCQAIAVCFCAVLPLGNSIIGLPGVIFWGFSGIFLAGNKYYQHQANSRIQRN
jgi:hypothetical protein